MRTEFFACLTVVIFVALVGCQKRQPTAPTPPAAVAAAHSSRPEGVAWFEGDIAQAFTAAEQQHKPVFVYFGAVWCPPCQELKATVFRRQDFLVKLSLFVPLYLDGDAPDAQRWAGQFKVTGYPTVLILRSNRNELERVSGNMDLTRYAEVLALGLSASRPISEILAAVAAGLGPLGADDCRRLAYNGWSLEEEWIFSEDHPGWLSTTSDSLTQAASRCPASQATERARIDIVATAAALEAESDALKAGKPPSARVAADVGRVRTVLNDEALAATVADDLEYLDANFFKTAAKLDPSHVATLEERWFQLMDAVAADRRYSIADRLYTTAGKIRAAEALERDGKVPPILADEAHQRVEAALALRTDAYTRTSLVNAALNILDALDDKERSYALLSGEIKTSKTPYYYMIDLAEIEEQRGHKDAAIDWLARSYQESQGQATRFQWGANYVRVLVRLRPDDEAGIRTTTRQVLGELDGDGRLYGRSSYRLILLAKSLHKWNDMGQHAAVIQDIRSQMNRICGKVPAGDPAQITCARFLQTL